MDPCIMTTDLEENLKSLNIKEDTVLNILLLGHTGVGKSTFINAVANYLSFDSLKTAENENRIVLIPSVFNIKDKHNKLHDVKVGLMDNNEYLEVGASATQDVKTYVFPISKGQIKVRLIDTPGMGDTRGIQQDDINTENILHYIGQLHELHAICFLFKPNESRATVYFNYCMKQILSRLDKSATNNIIFIFTNTRGTDYSPGDTISLLRKTAETLHQIRNIQIPLNKNIFCFDNEPFKYLVSIDQNLEFDNDFKKTMTESWRNSYEQCWKLIKYITGDKNNPPLKPHFVKSTNAINEARRLISRLSQPLAEISQLINHNVNLLERHKEALDLDNKTLTELKQKLYMPVVDLKVINLAQPVTVCTKRGCAEVIKVGNENSWHYKQRCHDPCYLTNVVKEMIGDPALVHCASMNNKHCIKCGCFFSIHMHVYYLTEKQESQQVDSNIQRNIDTKEKILKNVTRLIDEISKRKNELIAEHHIIIRCCAKFAHFLKNNAITPFNDAYKEYIEYLINREKSLGALCERNQVEHLQTLLTEYEEVKKSFDEALALGINNVEITPQNINQSIQELYGLKHNGKKIKELYECQKKSRQKEYQQSEYIHKFQFKKTESKDETKANESENTSQNRRRNRDNRGTNWNTSRADNTIQRNMSPPPPYELNRNTPAPNNQYNYPHYGQQYNYPPHGYHPPPPHGYPPPPPHGYPPPPPYGYPPPPPHGHPPPPPHGHPTGYDIRVTVNSDDQHTSHPPNEQYSSGAYGHSSYQQYPYGYYHPNYAPYPPTGPNYQSSSNQNNNRDVNRHGVNEQRGGNRGRSVYRTRRGSISKNYSKPKMNYNKRNMSNADSGNES